MEGADVPPLKEKKGLKTVWNRIKDFFREQPTAAQPAVSATITPSVPAPPVAPQMQAAEETPKSATPIEHSPEQETVNIDKERDQPIEPGSTSSQEPVDTKDATAESHMRFTKAQAIFARHNLELDETEWEPRLLDPGLKVERAMNAGLGLRQMLKNVPTATTKFARDVCMKPPLQSTRVTKPAKKHLKPNR
ncbi:hypothetical protein AYO21_00886 [Fonsecaea monophora]|uniref:Uncharacterized protein n=1 Tax=Fonsecaea monophora TaxID=254056 RepID=A0A177FKT5_9EURO|nr:hypothetical protein AYO21_00886 [Fonsecaea monophora]OAG44924.1 hypothetical protein AYO21_00886 [Fonsecaea monophora]